MIQPQKAAICKKCGAAIAASDLAKDPSQQFCRLCVAKAQPIGGIRTTTMPGSKPAPAAAPAPVIKSSSYMDRAAEKMESRSSDEKMRVKCKKCSFAFNYNVEKGIPKNCPYCKTPVTN